MRVRLWIATAAVGLVAGTAALWWAPQLLGRSEARTVEPDDAVAASRRVVMVTTARVAADATVRQLPGIIAARTEADLGFRVGGKVIERRVSVGDRVRAGDVVATLDDTDLRLQLEGAEAARAAARIALDKAEINLERVSTLRTNGWASSQASDNETVLVEEARARLMQAERSADLARNQLAYATLRADADGVVTAAMAEPGQVLTAGQPAVRIARAGEREAVVAIPEAMVSEVGDAAARVELWSEPGTEIAAKLRELSPIADSATRTFEARYALPDADKALELGMSVTVALSSAGEGPSADLPLSAIFDDGSGPRVWVVVAGDQLEARPVQVAGYDSGVARIAGGLADGERVVVLGAHKLEAGEPVVPVESES